MAHWPVLEREHALEALRVRREAVRVEIGRIEDTLMDKQPLPDFVEALFDYSLGQLGAEAEWITRTLDYMITKPWLE